MTNDELDSITDAELRKAAKRRGYMLVLTDEERERRAQHAHLLRRTRALGLALIGHNNPGPVYDFVAEVAGAAYGVRVAGSQVEFEPWDPSRPSSELTYEDALAFLDWVKPATKAEHAAFRVGGIKAVLDMRPTTEPTP